nr:EOG090X0HZC [Triops cancriformis]
MENSINSLPQNLNGQVNSTPSGMIALPASGLLPSSNSGNHNSSAAGTSFSMGENSSSKSADNLVLSRQRLQELVREVDPNEQLDEDVEEMLLQIADDFIESTVSAACMIAKHRKGNSLDVKDVQLHLERQWNMWIPGFGTEEVRPYKRAPVTEAHKQRMALIRKTLKKY